MVDAAAVQQAQAAAVRAVAASVSDLREGQWGDRDWLRILVDIEIETEPAKRISAQTSAFARQPGQPLEDLDFRLSREAKNALIALRESMRDGRGAWSTCKLRIDRDGKFAFDFSYEPPRRLGGDLLYSPLEGALQRYLAETGQN